MRFGHAAAAHKPSRRSQTTGAEAAAVATQLESLLVFYWPCAPLLRLVSHCARSIAGAWSWAALQP
jgi:hypothetical protein